MPEEVLQPDVVKSEDVQLEVHIPDIPVVKIEPDDKKSDIRMKVWNHLRDHNLATFPKPPHRRISNFIGAEEAGNRVASLEVFKNATNIRIDPDRPLLQIRMKTLEEQKTLFVPMPGMRNHVMSKIVRQSLGNKKSLRTCMTRQGVMDFGEPVDIDSDVKIDLVVVGCVAVSPKGWRIGKGTGLSDLEYAMIRSTGSVDSSVPVVTVVHECQILDLPDGLFTNQDVPVDYIVTPFRVIKCSDNVSGTGNNDQCPPKPTGIIWSLLNKEALTRVPVLRRLRFREWKAGKDVALSGELVETTLELTDVIEEEEVRKDDEPKRRNARGLRRRNTRPAKQTDKVDAETNGDKVDENPVENGTRPAENKRFSGNRRYRNGQPRRRNMDNHNDENEINGIKDHSTEKNGAEIIDNRGGDSHRSRNGTKEPKKQNSDGGKGEMADGRPEKSVRRRRIEYLGTVYVGALPRSARVSEFKAEVRERKVNPMRVQWCGSYGFAFLNFKTLEDAESALESLRGLQVSDKLLKIEMAHTSTNRSEGVNFRRGGNVRRGPPRRKRQPRRGSSDTGEASKVADTSAAPRHLSEDNMTAAANEI